MEEEVYPKTDGSSLPREVSKRLDSKRVRLIIFGAVLGGSLWIWWRTVRIAFGISFLASLSPALIPTMAFVLSFVAIGIVSSVFILIAGYRRDLAIGFTALYFVVTLATWLAALYGPGLVPLS